MDGGRALTVRRISVQVVTALALAALLIPVSRVDGQVRLTVPEQSPSGPFYARVERGAVLQTDEWVAIAFYRDPACVRADFNLLNFFDFANIPGIFSCPLTMHGFDIRDDPASAGPRQSKLQGDGAVPIWFVSVDDFNAALPGLTIAELQAMPSLLQGVATFYEETLHPMGIAKQSVLSIVASGDLPDGRTFHFVAVEAAGVIRHVSIAFR
jgi:hypothetical protein